MEKICIAGIPMEVQTTHTAFFHERFSAYTCLVDTAPMMRLHSKVCSHISQPVGQELSRVKDARVLKLPDGKLCRYEISEQTGQITYLSRYTPDFSEVEMELCPTNPSLAQDYEYLYTGAAFGNRLEFLGGSTLHGSAIAYQGEGVIFSAPSGTGKSTHTALWKRCFGDHVVHVNDDRPAIRIIDDRVMMYGTPWSGKTALNNPVEVPLRAIVFIERGTENTICKLNITESMLLLGGQIAKPYYDGDLGSKVVDLMVELVQRVPIYRLTCNMDPAAAYTARDGIFLEEKSV